MAVPDDLNNDQSLLIKWCQLYNKPLYESVIINKIADVICYHYLYDKNPYTWKEDLKMKKKKIAQAMVTVLGLTVL